MKQFPDIQSSSHPSTRLNQRVSPQIRYLLIEFVDQIRIAGLCMRSFLKMGFVVVLRLFVFVLQLTVATMTPDGGSAVAGEGGGHQTDVSSGEDIVSS